MGTSIYAFARLVPDPDADPNGILPESVIDPETHDLDDQTHWIANGAVHFGHSIYVPDGTRVWMTQEGDRPQFEVTEPLVGIVNQVDFRPVSDYQTYLDDLPSARFHRLQLPDALGVREPETARQLVTQGNPVNNRVFFHFRARPRTGSLFTAAWYRDRYIILGVDPFADASGVEAVEYE